MLSLEKKIFFPLYDFPLIWGRLWRVLPADKGRYLCTKLQPDKELPSAKITEFPQPGAFSRSISWNRKPSAPPALTPAHHPSTHLNVNAATHSLSPPPLLSPGSNLFTKARKFRVGQTLPGDTRPVTKSKSPLPCSQASAAPRPCPCTGPGHLPPRRPDTLLVTTLALSSKLTESNSPQKAKLASIGFHARPRWGPTRSRLGF